MRTTIVDVLSLAWALLRCRYSRRHLRLGQLLLDANPRLYYIENGAAIARNLREYNSGSRTMAND